MTERRVCHGSYSPGLPRCVESKNVPTFRQVMLPPAQGSKRSQISSRLKGVTLQMAVLYRPQESTPSLQNVIVL